MNYKFEVFRYISIIGTVKLKKRSIILMDLLLQILETTIFEKTTIGNNIN
jgi:hypothetical protein